MGIIFPKQVSLKERVNSIGNSKHEKIANSNFTNSSSTMKLSPKKSSRNISVNGSSRQVSINAPNKEEELYYAEKLANKI